MPKPDTPNTLDGFDLKLLSLLQENNQMTAQQLSEHVHLSPVSCLRRIKRLREQRVIHKDVSIVNPEKVGHTMTMVVLVALERERQDMSDHFKQSMLKLPEVMQCYYVTGEFDFVLILTVKDMQAYEEFSTRFFFENKNIRRFNTLVVISRVKVGMSIPLG